MSLFESGSSAAGLQPVLSGLSDLYKYSLDHARSNDKLFQDLFRENQGVGRQVTDFALGQADYFQSIQQDDRQLWEDTYRPLMVQQALTAQDWASPGRQQLEAGRAQADVAQQFNQAKTAAEQRLESYGVDPSQMRMGSLALGANLAQAAASEGAGNQARYRTEMTGQQLMQQAIANGMAIPGQSLSEGQAANSSANQGVNTGLAETASAAQTKGTPFQWAGAAGTNLGQWGNLLNDQERNRIEAEKNKQGESSGIGSILGAAASFIPMFAQEGGAIPEEEGMSDAGRYLDPAMSPSNGAIPDDIEAEISDSGRPARINAGEFIFPKDVVQWLGEKGLQQIILKARKEMGNEEQRPAQPEVSQPQQQMIPPRGIAAIPDQGVA